MSATSSAQSVTNAANYDNYVMDSNNQIEGMRRGGRGNASVIVTYTDKTEWIFLNNVPKERFCGFLYLENALKEAGLSKIKAAANKLAIHDRNIIYLSQYCGEQRLDLFSGNIDRVDIEQLTTLQKVIGFADMAAYANLRKMGDEIYVFDTEKHSFDPSVRDKIDALANVHDAIRSSLEERLKS